MLRDVAPAVVQVFGDDCPGAAAARVGSGFLWDRADRAVTALHIVGGCRAVRVLFQDIGMREARVERSLVARDLTVLQVVNPPSVRALPISTDVPPPNQRVWVYGYGGGRATREDRELRVTDANRATPLLEHAVDPAVRSELLQLRAPALDTEVLRVEGFLLPGDSGAPVLDARGRVVAIGSGGLQRGTIGAGWAVRAKYLVDGAERWTAGAPAVTPGAARFALVDPRVRAELRCGDLVFRRTRVLSLRDLAATSDDPLGLEQIAASFGTTTAAFAELRFELWTEGQSGAAVAVPEGVTVERGAAGCSAALVPGMPPAVQLAWTGRRLRGTPPASMDAQRASQHFQAAWGQEFQPFLTANPAFTYPDIRAAAGGFIRRMSWWGQRPGAFWHMAFETHLAHPDAYVGVVAINRTFNPFGPQHPALLPGWIQAVIATHLSTLAR